jgi:hypothetical protein
MNECWRDGGVGDRHSKQNFVPAGRPVDLPLVRRIGLRHTDEIGLVGVGSAKIVATSTTLM